MGRGDGVDVTIGVGVVVEGVIVVEDDVEDAAAAAAAMADVNSPRCPCRPCMALHWDRRIGGNGGWPLPRLRALAYKLCW